MSFAKDLEHIRRELSSPQKGYRDGFTMVRTKALSNLLHHFERLDREIHEQYARDHERGGAI